MMESIYSRADDVIADLGKAKDGLNRLLDMFKDLASIYNEQFGEFMAAGELGGILDAFGYPRLDFVVGFDEVRYSTVVSTRVGYAGITLARKCSLMLGKRRLDPGIYVWPRPDPGS